MVLQGFLSLGSGSGSACILFCMLKALFRSLQNRLYRRLYMVLYRTFLKLVLLLFKCDSVTAAELWYRIEPHTSFPKEPLKIRVSRFICAVGTAAAGSRAGCEIGGPLRPVVHAQATSAAHTLTVLEWDTLDLYDSLGCC